MYIVNNCADERNRGRMIVLKAYGLSNLRLFPGYNKIAPNTDITPYFDSTVAKAILQKSLTVIDSEGIPSEKKGEAIAAMEKNAALNRDKAKIPVITPKEVSENDLLKMATDMAMKMAGPMAKEMAKEIMTEAAAAARLEERKKKADERDKTQNEMDEPEKAEKVVSKTTEKVTLPKTTKNK